MTELLYRDDPYLREAAAVVTAVRPEGFELDRTVFYASSGGQPGDTGRIWRAPAAVAGTVHPDGDRARVLHLVAGDGLARPASRPDRPRLGRAAPADADA